MRKVKLIMEAADLAAYHAEQGIEKVVVTHENKTVCAVEIPKSNAAQKWVIKMKLIKTLGIKLSQVSDIEELEYLLAA